MTDKLAFHALDKTLRDIKGNNYRFGGIPIVFGGDFRNNKYVQKTISKILPNSIFFLILSNS